MLPLPMLCIDQPQVSLNILNVTAVAYGRARFGQAASQVPINMDDLQCSGSELRLTACSFIGSDRENCIHAEDAGVRCEFQRLVEL